MEPSAVYPSPDGRFVLELYPMPMRMSHEVHNPYLFETESRECIFTTGSLWQGNSVEWSEDSQKLNMLLQLYPDGTRSFSLALDLENSTARLSFDERSIFSGTFAEVTKAMEAVFNIRDLLSRG